MLRVLEDLIGRVERFLGEDAAAPPSADAERALRLGAAVLLVEVMRADGEFGDDEQQAVLASLRGLFGLDADAAGQLAACARSTAQTSTDLYTFTSRLNERVDMAGKIRIVEAMWRVAYADGTLAAHERHMVWRIADLLHVPQGALHLARERVLGGKG